MTLKMSVGEQCRPVSKNSGSRWVFSLLGFGALPMRKSKGVEKHFIDEVPTTKVMIVKCDRCAGYGRRVYVGCCPGEEKVIDCFACAGVGLVEVTNVLR
jgi:hypothetical protein